MAFRCLQAKVAEKEEALRVSTIEVGTLQASLGIERQSSTLSPTLERELIRLRHAYNILSEVARDLGFDAARFKGLKDCPIVGFLGSLIC